MYLDEPTQSANKQHEVNVSINVNHTIDSQESFNASHKINVKFSDNEDDITAHSESDFSGSMNNLHKLIDRFVDHITSAFQETYRRYSRS